jgi:hypothetical protein
MAKSIKPAEADRLAQEPTVPTGESITEAVTRAQKSRPDRERRERHVSRQKLSEIAARAASFPVLDKRPDEEILGYNDWGTLRLSGVGTCIGVRQALG